MKTVSILTPTYNRGSCLKDLYQSLCNQTNKDFEWIIVDDGSLDDTSDIVSRFSTDFPIKYHKKNNGGKHTALNVGYDLLDSQYTIIVDSDDMLTNDAIDIIIKTWNRFQNEPRIGVVCFLRIDKQGKAYGGKFPIDGETTSLFKMCYSADKAETFRTSVLKQYRFPEIEGENFIGEGVVWSEIAKDYLYAFFNQGIYVCEYLEGGLTKSGRALRINNPKGGMVCYNVHMSCPYSLKKILKFVILYDVYSLFSKNNIFKCLKECNKPILSVLLLPLSIAIYIYWNWKYT